MDVNGEGHKCSIAAYKRGSRDAGCRAANAAARRRQRSAKPDAPRSSHAAKPKPDAPTNVVALPTHHKLDASPDMGPNERATREECELAPKAKDRPSIVAQAITIAQRLDDPAMAAVAATNSRQLQALLKELQGPKKKLGGRMATVSAMAGRRVAQ